MSPATLLAHLRRDARGSRGRVAFFVVCLSFGVAAVVAVAGLSEGLERGVRGEARRLLAADLAVEGRRPIPAAVEQAVDRWGAERATIREMVTLVATPPAAGGRSLLVELKAVDGGYPFYGELRLDPPLPLAAALGADGLAAAPELLRRLQIDVGDTLRVGGEPFRVTARVLAEPDRITGAFSLGPRLFVSAEGLARAGLEQLGSRVLYRMLVRLPPARQEALEEVKGEIEALLPADRRYRLESYRDGRPELRRGFERVERYLGLAALLSLLVGGLGVAQTVRSWVAGRLDAIAVLKCVGYRPREVLTLYLAQAAVLGLVGSLVGVALGAGLELLAVRLLAGLVPAALIDPWQPVAIGRGLVLGAGVTLLASLPPLAAARRVPPIRVLRRDAEPLPPSRTARAAGGAATTAAVLAMATWQGGSLDLGVRFTLALGATAAVLAAAALLLTRLVARPRRLARPWLRYGLATLARPGAATLGAIVALGLGVLLVLAMFLVERRLRDQLDRDVPRDAPTAFLIDIQPEQWEGVRSLLERSGAERIDSVPVVMARLAAIDGRPVGEIAGDAGTRRGSRWALTREQRLTYLATLPADNRVVAGALWSDPQVAEISVEEEFAADLGIGVGSQLRFDVQGVPIELTVTSLRQVGWESFGINFFLVVEPGVLEAAPQTRVAAARLPAGRDQEAQDALAAAFPNVTVLQVRQVLEKVSAVLARLGTGVRLLGAVTVAAGLVILAGAVGARSLARAVEAALLKTLGMTRAEVAATLATEQALVGLVAGVVGTGGGVVVAWFVVTRRLEIAWHFHPAIAAAAVAATVLLAVAAGFLATLGALGRRPARVLREGAE